LQNYRYRGWLSFGRCNRLHRLWRDVQVARPHAITRQQLNPELDGKALGAAPNITL
jgi:hypothetical protein